MTDKTDLLIKLLQEFSANSNDQQKLRSSDYELQHLIDRIIYKLVSQTSKDNNQSSNSIFGELDLPGPALLRAYKISIKANSIGFDWPDPHSSFAKTKEELEEFESAIKSNNQGDIEDEFGDLLFSLINTAKFFKINPEESLNKSLDKFLRRFRFLEQSVSNDKLTLKELSLDQLDRYWEKAKEMECD
ncbi:MAG: MazG nucleotide pyrophosphohydrolase domain-containing protein [Nitrospinota bacterium]